MSRIPTYPTNRIVKPFISHHSLITTDNRPLSELIIFKGSGHGWALKRLLYVTIIVTSKSRRTHKLSHVCSSTNQRPLWGIAARKLLHISPHGNFMLYGVYPIVSYGLHESIINEWWIINLQSSIISPLIAMSELFSSRISGTVTYRGV